MKKQTGAMNRRELLQRSAAFGVMAAIPSTLIGCASTVSGKVEAAKTEQDKPTAILNPLKPPAQGGINVAILISEDVDTIDVFGPWEIFHQANAFIPTQFRTYSVGETTKPVNPLMSGIKLIPEYTLETAPAPKIVIIPAQSGQSEAMLEWIRKAAKNTDVTFSVCSGASLLARTGLLSGKSATTHHAEYRELAVAYPDIHVKRGSRFVEEGNVATSGGLFSGIDLALRVVERYFGREAARKTAYQCEYQGEGWLDPNSNAVYAQVKDSTEEHPLCPVCEMAIPNTATAPKSVYKGKTYYFMSEDMKQEFDAAPEKYLKLAEKKQ